MPRANIILYIEVEDKNDFASQGHVHVQTIVLNINDMLISTNRSHKLLKLVGDSWLLLARFLHLCGSFTADFGAWPTLYTV